LIWYSWDPICRGVAFEFLCSPEVICGNTGKDVQVLRLHFMALHSSWRQ